MSRLLVLCNPSERSFFHAIASTCAEVLGRGGAELVTHDLYAESPDPVLTQSDISRRTTLDPQIQRYSAELASSKILVVVHPDWWGGPPALLKGWIDRVFRAGVAYEWAGGEFEEKRHAPLLTGLDLYCYITTDRTGSEPDDSPGATWAEVCRYSGASLRELRIFRDLRGSSLQQRRDYLAEVAKTMQDSLDT